MIVLTMDHRQWRDFYVRLNDRLIRESGCKNHSLKYTRQILATIKNVAIEETIEYFKKLGGVCDCSVIYYVFKHEPKPERYFFKEKHKKKKVKLSYEEEVTRKNNRDKWRKSRYRQCNRHC